MSRIIWILVFALAAVLFVKPLRERASPHIEFALNPVYKWDTKNRVNELVRLIERERATGGMVVTPRDFEKFLSNREGADAIRDVWGQPYFMEANKRTMRVGSAGPDRTRGTVDDIYSEPEPAAGARSR
jgi:hypothetical protein